MIDPRPLLKFLQIVNYYTAESSSFKLIVRMWQISAILRLPDSLEMVQCDSFDGWFHFICGMWSLQPKAITDNCRNTKDLQKVCDKKEKDWRIKRDAEYLEKEYSILDQASPASDDDSQVYQRLVELIYCQL